MVGVHVFIGVGEGVISALVVGAVLLSRPDLVYGARDLDKARLADRTPVRMRVFAIAGIIAALFIAAVVSQFAVSGPDGLERVAQDAGLVESPADHTLGGSVFADYATDGIENETLSLAVAGITGTLIALAVGLGVFYAVRERPRGSPRDPLTA